MLRSTLFVLLALPMLAYADSAPPASTSAPAVATPASAPATAPAAVASFAGTYSDGRLTMVLGVAPREKAKDGDYVGTITLDGKTYDCVGWPKQMSGVHGLVGTFTVGGNPFQFTAVPQEGGLLLHSADADYHLKNITPPAAVPATLPAR